MLNPLSFISKIFKSSNDIELAKFRKILEKINSLENLTKMNSRHVGVLSRAIHAGIYTDNRAFVL